MSEWTPVGGCINGQQSYIRTVITPALNGGTSCPVLSKTEPCEEPGDCVSLISNTISPPQTGLNNYFGVNVAINPWPVSEDITVSGYIVDDRNPNIRQDFSITITSPNQFGETANNILQTAPDATATAHITGFSPTNVTFEGESYIICGYEPSECKEFSLRASEIDRAFNFTNCSGLPQRVIIPQGDEATFCIRLPFSADGAVEIGDCSV